MTFTKAAQVLIAAAQCILVAFLFGAAWGACQLGARVVLSWAP